LSLALLQFRKIYVYVSLRHNCQFRMAMTCAIFHCTQINAFTNVSIRESWIRLRARIHQVSNKISFRRIASVSKLYRTILRNFQTFLSINSRKSQTQDTTKGRDGTTERRKRRAIPQRFDRRSRTCTGNATLRVYAAGGSYRRSSWCYYVSNL